MIVRFDGKALQQNLDHKEPPIGVEGDPSETKGGLSEADNIVKEARKSVGDVKGIDEDLKEEVEQEAAQETHEKEAGPEVDAEGLKQVTKQK